VVAAAVVVFGAPTGVAAESVQRSIRDPRCQETASFITCVALTESLLLRLRHAARGDVQATLRAEGRPLGPRELRFVSNPRVGTSGTVNVMFDAGDRAAIIVAKIDTVAGSGTGEWIWNAELGGLQCSDFPNSRRRCQLR
jgi:hypothetical protein